MNACNEDDLVEANLRGTYTHPNCLRLQLPEVDRALQAGMDNHIGAFTCRARTPMQEAEFAIATEDV